jgi:hypothetical protein
VKNIVKFIMLKKQIGFFFNIWVVLDISSNLGGGFYILPILKVSSPIRFFFLLCSVHMSCLDTLSVKPEIARGGESRTLIMALVVVWVSFTLKTHFSLQYP